ncbi:hypothetical protein CYY_000216 [Polysphondylium violaceum]|uniref:FNIP repeat-containing protein n=1 Tax=Polysphondylium violaceum TaxID=133409 RepID=A0A8J4UXD5_9MYCE|nr:hypothetical protein CYY_000216 [Polysphondylium violaceum]
MNSFYIIYRNQYLKRNIIKYIFEGSLLNVCLSRLNEYHEFLSLITNNTDNNNSTTYNNNNNISIRLIIKNHQEFKEYINHPYRYIVNTLHLGQLKNVSSFVNGGNKFDFGCIPESVTSLEFHISNDDIQGYGRFPQSITELKVNTNMFFEYEGNLLDYLIHHLPPRLARLKLPSNVQIREEWVVPESLVDLVCMFEASLCSNIVVAPTRVFKSSYVMINSIVELELLQSSKWMRSISIGAIHYPEQPHLFPPHIEEIVVYDHHDLHPVYLDKHMLPPCLTSLAVHQIDHPIARDTLPESLISLTIDVYKHPIRIGVMPVGLTILYISCQHPLEPGTLPLSLTHVNLYGFNHPLRANVLPEGLQELTLSAFKNILEPKSLPRSLTFLQLNKFKGSFESVGPLNQLVKLHIHTMDASISTVIANVKNLELLIKGPTIIHPSILLHSTSIEKLALYNHSRKLDRISLPPDFFPPTLIHLALFGFEIKSPNILPRDCIFFRHNIQDLDTNLLPPSVKYNKKEEYKIK